MSFDDREMIRLRKCPETCIGVVICCSKPKVSLSSMNFLASASLESSRLKLNSPETTVARLQDITQ